MIIERLKVGPFATNCYIVGDESSQEGIIIDPGAEANKILKKVKDLGLNIKFMVLTHAHIDHIGAAKEVKEATGAELAVHTEDANFQERSLSSLSGYPLPSVPPPDKLLEDDDRLDIGDLHLLVRHTPGHSPGGICLLAEEAIFTGDTLFNLNIGGTGMPGSNIDLLINSIHTKLMTLPDNTIVYPGHGLPTTIGGERRWNPWLRG